MACGQLDIYSWAPCPFPPDPGELQLCILHLPQAVPGLCSAAQSPPALAGPRGCCWMRFFELTHHEIDSQGHPLRRPGLICSLRGKIPAKSGSSLSLRERGQLLPLDPLCYVAPLVSELHRDVAVKHDQK